jgi:hypothetical protein
LGSSVPSEEPFGGEEGGFEEPAAEKPFDDTPFDAGVEADEDASPEKYIQQLAGKLGQSLRSYTNDSGGEPNFDLEKFAINSVLSATNSGKMDQNDQSDIISKVKSSGSDGGEAEGGLDGLDIPNEEGGEEGGESPDIDLDDIEMEEGFNPNGNGKTVFQEMTLGVKDGGMEENKYLNLENTKKSSIFVDNIKTMVRQTLTESPTIEPITKPITVPNPSRKSKPWIITPKKHPNPKPKAKNGTILEGGEDVIIPVPPFKTPSAESVIIKFKIGANNPEIAKFVNQNIEQPDNFDEASLNDVPYEYTYKTEEPIEGSYYATKVSFNGDAFNGGEFMSFGDSEMPVIEKI